MKKSRVPYPTCVSECSSFFCFFFESRRRHTRCLSDWSSDVCSSDLLHPVLHEPAKLDNVIISTGCRLDLLAHRRRSSERAVAVVVPGVAERNQASDLRPN